MLKFDDDSGPGLNARITGDFAPGRYVVVVTAFRANIGGTYTMDLTNAVFGAAPLPPPFSLALSQANLVATRNAAIAPVTATVQGGTPPFAFSINPPLPAGLTLDPDTGTISGTPTEAHPTTTHTVTVTELGGNGEMTPLDQPVGRLEAMPTATAMIDITVNHPPLALSLSPNVVVATRGQPMTSVIATATGGSEQGYEFSVFPSLPDGVSFDPATGTISGTPSVGQPTTLHTVTVIDTGGNGLIAADMGDRAVAAEEAPHQSATATLELTVLDQPLGLSLNPSNVVAVRGRAMPEVVATVSGAGEGPLEFSVAPPLPPGVVLDPATGRVSGVPMAVQPAREHVVTVRRSRPAVASGGSAASPPPDETASATLSLTVIEDDARVAQAFDEATGAFLARRNERVLAAEPRAWRLDRRRAAAGSSGTDLALRATDDGLALRLATARVSADARWYGWAEGEYADFRDGAAGPGRTSGRFGMISAGADMLLNDRVSLGFMVQADSASETVPDLSRVAGDGWLAGPYMSAELRPGLFLSTRAAWGRSRNTAEVDVYQDGSARFAGAFTTGRTLLRATLHGEHELAGGTRILPEIDYGWIRDRQAGYSVTDGISTVAVAGLTSELHRLSAGATIETPLPGSNGRALMFVRPMLTMNQTRTGATRTRAGQGSVELGLRTGAEARWSGEAALRLDSGGGGFRAVALRASAAVNF